MQTDKDGFLIRGPGPEKITGKWKEVVDELVESYKKHLGQKLVSVYIEGSVARGAAIENKSDVDSFAMVKMSEEEIEQAHQTWVEAERERIDALFPFQRGVEMHFVNVDRLNDEQKFHTRFQIKIMAACVFGKDFGPEISAIKLDKDLIRCIRVDIGRAIRIAKEELEPESNPKEIARICSWIGKRIVRAGGMLVLWKGDFFTTDIESLAKIFIEQYPEKQNEMKKALDYAEKPIESKKEILDFLGSFGAWMTEEDKGVFESNS